MTHYRILVIDDQAASRATIVDGILALQGCSAVGAADMDQALKAVDGIQPDLVVLNGSSPGLGGLDVLEALRGRHVDAPALIVLPAGTTRVDVRALELGVCQVITEPLDADKVGVAIGRALAPALGRMQESRQDQLDKQRRLYTIGQAIAAQTEWQKVCDRLVEAAIYVTRADAGYLFFKDADSGEVHLRARMKQGQQTAQAVDQRVRDPMIQRVLSSGSPGFPPEGSSIAADASVSSMIDVPLCVRERCIGVLRLLRADATNLFGIREHHDLSVLTSYAVLALENVNLVQGIQDAVERVAICQISTYFASKLRIQEVAEMVLDVAVRIVGASRGCIILLDERTGQHTPRVSYGFSLDDGDDPLDVPAKQAIHHVLDRREPLMLVTEPMATEDGADIPSRPVLAVPVGDEPRVSGAIYVEGSDPDRPFTEHHRSTLGALAANAAMALANARLFEQVEAESRKLDAVLRGTDQPVIVTDMDGTVLLMNRAASRAFTSHRGKGTGLFFPRAVEHPGLTNLFQQARVSGHVQRGEVVTEDDRTFGATVTPIPDIGTVMVLQDITEIKKLSQLKTEFVATVSHDLRSPLSTVQGFLSVLDQIGPINAQQADFIASAQREVTRLFDLTKDLLDLGRLESGIDLTMAPCDLQQVVTKAVASWQSQARKKQHSLTADLLPERVPIVGNGALLWRLVDNLLSNAIKYSLPGSQIEVRLKLVGREAVLEVQDTGIGIPAKDQPYVFDRFYRVWNEQTSDVEGTGLGLAIVRSIVERHNGRVWLESESGVGTTIGVSLPIAEGEDVRSR